MESAPRWLTVAMGEHGVKETPGPRSTPRILEYSKATRGGSPNGDETPWCSQFVNWVMQQVGITGTGSAAAISWVTWGLGLQVPRLGSIAVYQRDDPSNPHAAHVAFWLARVGPWDIVLGGNQGNEVSIKPRVAARCMSYRTPITDP